MIDDDSLSERWNATLLSHGRSLRTQITPQKALYRATLGLSPWNCGIKPVLHPKTPLLISPQVSTVAFPYSRSCPVYVPLPAVLLTSRTSDSLGVATSRLELNFYLVHTLRLLVQFQREKGDLSVYLSPYFFRVFHIRTLAAYSVPCPTTARAPSRSLRTDVRALCLPALPSPIPFLNRPSILHHRRSPAPWLPLQQMPNRRNNAGCP